MRKIIDVKPPSHNIGLVQDKQGTAREPQYEEISASSTVWMLKFGIGAVVVGAGAMFALHIFFASVRVDIQPASRSVSFASNVTHEMVSVESYQAEHEITRLFSSTGTKDQEVKASGTIRVYNNFSSKPQTLVQNTRFISQEGKLFRSTARAEIPGHGYADVDVLAAEAGEEYNVGPSNFSLPGLAGTALYTLVYGESFDGMSGGQVQNVSAVTKEDIARARDELVQEVTSKAVNKAISQVPEHIMVLEDSIRHEILEASSLVQEGSVLDKFNYTVRVRATALGVSHDDREILARNILQGEMAESERIDEKSLTATWATESQNPESGTAVLRMHATATVFETIDTTQLRLRLRGTSIDQAKELLAQYPSLISAQVSLWPFWITGIPEDIDRINVSSSLD